jgi:hypothetical protein
MVPLSHTYTPYLQYVRIIPDRWTNELIAHFGCKFGVQIWGWQAAGAHPLGMTGAHKKGRNNVHGHYHSPFFEGGIPGFCVGPVDISLIGEKESGN